MIHMLLMMVIAVSPAELEAEGRLVEAGAAWEARGNLEGQVRVMTSMMEDALYSADVRRAWLLASELSSMGVGQDLLNFWGARIAWASGMGGQASRTLWVLQTDDQWLLHRARGLSLLYGGNPSDAVMELAASVSVAGTGRRGFYSSLDLATALIASGQTEKALQVADLLRAEFPSEALAMVLRGLCLQLNGSTAEAVRELATLSPGHPSGARSIATRLLREFVE